MEHEVTLPKSDREQTSDFRFSKKLISFLLVRLKRNLAYHRHEDYAVFISRGLTCSVKLGAIETLNVGIK